MKIGELAARTGVSVRALRHYDEIGLLRPVTRTGGNQRLYGAAEIARLQQIASLRRLGLGLDAIRRLLDGGEANAAEVMAAHARAVRAEIATLERLAGLLEIAEAESRASGRVEIPRLLALTEASTMVERHYTAEQLEALARRRRDLGEERIREVQDAWPRLIDAVLAAKDRGLTPDHPDVQALVAQWRELIAAFTGGDAAIERNLDRVWREDGDQLIQQHGLNPRLPEATAFIAAAIEAG